MRLRILSQAGEPVEGRTEEWLAAIIATMPQSQQRAVFDLILKPGSGGVMLTAIIGALPELQRAQVLEKVAGKVVGHSTPGRHILNAESGALKLFESARKP